MNVPELFFPRCQFAALDSIDSIHVVFAACSHSFFLSSDLADITQNYECDLKRYRYSFSLKPRRKCSSSFSAKVLGHHGIGGCHVKSHVSAPATMRVHSSLETIPYLFAAGAPSPWTVATLLTMTEIPVPSHSVERTCSI